MDNSPEDRQLAVLDLKSGEQKTLLRGGIAAAYLDTGHLVYALRDPTDRPGRSGLSHSISIASRWGGTRPCQRDVAG